MTEVYITMTLEFDESADWVEDKITQWWDENQMSIEDFMVLCKAYSVEGIPLEEGYTLIKRG